MQSLLLFYYNKVFQWEHIGLYSEEVMADVYHTNALFVSRL